uniref:NADH-ubiquinone oxidoreductase chain 4L n=1 Tax=Belzebub intermedius TaxID=2306298 RepID=A0A346RNI1_9EUCA|nr:NADH dehydrogenase subunit 4L [Belzebub intermedius]AXS67628.1 NADH dehydrogenase subunit 4L [Belzebub intermedius]
MIVLSMFKLLMILSIFMGLISFVSSRKHMLNSLLSLEFIMLMLFCFVSMSFQNLGTETYFLSFFLTMAACEGSLGLGLLVSLVRTHGNDYFNNFSVLLC